MITLRFTIPGEPRGKGRPRFGRTAHGHVRTYTDDKTASYENLVRYAAAKALGQIRPTDRPVEMTVMVRLAPPASASKRQRAEMLSGERSPTKKPDLDNVVKAVMDGCNGVAFADDKQIVSLVASKVYAETAGVDVTVTTRTEAVAA